MNLVGEECHGIESGCNSLGDVSSHRVAEFSLGPAEMAD
jgi:hypothetical protein